MALDRTWYNTLVDDDGSNTVGTVWNKAAIDALMDDIDAALSASGVGVGFKNRLINGSMAINQRVAGSTADDVYCLDRWYALTQTAAVTVSQQTTQETGQPFNIRLSQAQAAAQRMGLAQIVETLNSVCDRGQAMVLSARIRCSASQAIRFAILEWTGGADTVTSDVVNDWTNGTYTASNFFLAASLTVTAVGTITPTAATWTSIEVTGTLGASVNNLIVLFWTEGTAAQNVTLDIGNVQLERGALASGVEVRPYGLERGLCQRYYASTFQPGTAPADNAGYTHCLLGKCGSAADYEPNCTFHFPSDMRAVPTVTLYNPGSGTAGMFGNPPSTTAAGTARALQINQRFIGIDNSGTISGSAGTQYFIGVRAVAEL